MKRKIGSSRSLCQAPDMVIMPLIMPPQLGASRISDSTMPTDWVQSGSAV